jgi:hypothetical protein
MLHRGFEPMIQDSKSWVLTTTLMEQLIVGGKAPIATPPAKISEIHFFK